MCYATKRKIADCVKQLMKKKEIRKIAIHDIMNETNMSRQSFYYHFKDIYDVLEWITKQDFTDRISCVDGQSIEEWALELLHVLDEERPFFERLVNQMEWPRLLPMLSEPVEKKMRQLLEQFSSVSETREQFEFCVHFATTAYCYYLMDYIYHRKKKSDEQLRSEVHSLQLFIGKKTP